jgi:hypothetical protein
MLIFFYMVCTKQFGRQDLGNCQGRSFYCMITPSIYGISDEDNIVNTGLGMNHPSYSCRLAPTDFYLFRPMEICLTEQKLQMDGEIKCDALNWLPNQNKTFYVCGITNLPG